MAFPDSVVEAVWQIVNGKCEKCGKQLVWDNRGREDRGAWEAHHIDGNPNNNTHSNCRILYWDCHRLTL